MKNLLHQFTPSFLSIFRPPKKKIQIYLLYSNHDGKSIYEYGSYQYWSGCRRHPIEFISFPFTRAINKHYKQPASIMNYFFRVFFLLTLTPHCLTVHDDDDGVNWSNFIFYFFAWCERKKEKIFKLDLTCML